MSTTVIRSRPELAERNLRNAVRVYVPASVQVYGQDLVDILAELDAVRRRIEQAQAAAVGALELTDPASPVAMTAAGRARA